MKNLLVVVIILILSACASTKKDFVFDGSTIESTKQGISKVSKRLKPMQQIEFMMALMAIQFSDVSSVNDDTRSNNEPTSDIRYSGKAAPRVAERKSQISAIG